MGVLCGLGVQLGSCYPSTCSPSISDRIGLSLYTGAEMRLPLIRKEMRMSNNENSQTTSHGPGRREGSFNLNIKANSGNELMNANAVSFAPCR